MNGIKVLEKFLGENSNKNISRKGVGL